MFHFSADRLRKRGEGGGAGGGGGGEKGGGVDVHSGRELSAILEGSPHLPSP